MKVVPDIVGLDRSKISPSGPVSEAFTTNNDRSDGFIRTIQSRETSDPLRTILPPLLVTVTDCGSGTVGRGNELYYSCLH